MRLWAMLALIFVGWPGNALASQVQVLVLPPQHAADLPAKDAEILAGMMAEQLAKIPDIDVVTAADLKDLAAVEQGGETCADQSCVLEIAGAMGIALALVGELSHDPRAWALRLGLYDMEQGAMVSRHQLQARRIEDLALALDSALTPWFIHALKVRDNPALATQSPAAMGAAREVPPAQVDPAKIPDAEPPLKVNSPRQPSHRDSNVDAPGPLGPFLGAGLGLVGAVLVAGVSVVASGLMAWQLADPEASRSDKDQALSLGPVLLVGGLAVSGGLAVGSAALAWWGLS